MARLLLSLLALQDVIMTTYSAPNDEKIAIVTILDFQQWIIIWFPILFFLAIVIFYIIHYRVVCI